MRTLIILSGRRRTMSTRACSRRRIAGGELELRPFCAAPRSDSMATSWTTRFARPPINRRRMLLLLVRPLEPLLQGNPDSFALRYRAERITMIACRQRRGDQLDRFRSGDLEENNKSVADVAQHQWSKRLSVQLIEADGRSGRKTQCRGAPCGAPKPDGRPLDVRTSDGSFLGRV